MQVMYSGGIFDCDCPRAGDLSPSDLPGIMTCGRIHGINVVSEVTA